MRLIKQKNMDILKKAALGLISCDLTITNVQLFNVFTGEIYPAEVDVKDGFIVRIRESHQSQKVASNNYYDGQGNYLVPGFIDTHVHVESTMLIPENLSRAILPWGTTTICTDPHEIANVMGIDGVEFMLENAKKSKLRQYVLAPSCVPAVVGLEHSGANFTDKEIKKMLAMDEVIGIAEIMDYVNVIQDEKRIHDIIQAGLDQDVYLQGHCPLLRDEYLAAYLIGGPCSCHESSKAEEVKQKIRNGMHINLRVSSLCDDAYEIAQGLKDSEYLDFVSFCTDDVHAKDLLTEGHLNYVIKKYIQQGLDPKMCYRMASLNAAREYGFKDLGAIAPGYIADMQIIRDFDGSCPISVFVEGELVAEKGVYTASDRLEKEIDFPNTIQIPQIKGIDDLRLAVPKGYHQSTIQVNVVVKDNPKSGMRHVQPMELDVVDGYVDISNHESLVYVCSCNRYGTGDKTIAIYQDFGLHQGALASSISHDNHNLNIVYRKPEDGYLCARELQKCAGGICVIKDGQSHLVKLPIAGLMSSKNAEEITKEIAEVQQVLSSITQQQVHLLSTAVLSLTALPSVVITDLGLVDGQNQCFVDVFAKK